MAYPTICQENRPPAAQRYSHPWPVGIIGDIRYPDLVWAWRIEILLKQIGKYWVCVVGVCYHFELFTILAQIPSLRINLATLFSIQRMLLAFSSFVIRGLP